MRAIEVGAARGRRTNCAKAASRSAAPYRRIEGTSLENHMAEPGPTGRSEAAGARAGECGAEVRGPETVSRAVRHAGQRHYPRGCRGDIRRRTGPAFRA